MEKYQTQQKVGVLFVVLCLAIGTINLADFLTREVSVSIVSIVTNVGVLYLLSGLGLFLVLLDKSPVRIALILLFLLPSGPALAYSSMSFIGMWMFIIAATMVIKFHPIPKHELWVFVLCVLYFLPWLVIAVTAQPDDGQRSFIRIVEFLLFLIVGVLTLYFLFEEEIQNLTKINQKNQADLVEKSATIARMEPLSVLGERISHVTHSFKNNLSQLNAVATILENDRDVDKGTALLREVSQGLEDRIENILMVSQAGGNPEPERFDVTRIIEGMKFVYLAEPTFQKKIHSEVSLEGELFVTAVRWDFILMMENLLKNAYEAISERGVRGMVRITLVGGLLTIGNNGGAMPLCASCVGSCLACPEYGHLGKTTKPGGTGLGLTQVFSTCRKYQWALRIRTEGDWTYFQILLPDPRAQAGVGAKGH